MIDLFRQMRFAPLAFLLTIPTWADPLLYTTGPVNGTQGGYTINSGYVVTDSFVLPSDSTVTGLSNIGIWLIAGDTVTSLDWTISTAPDDGGTLESQTNANPLSATELTPTSSYGFGYYNVYNVSFSVPALNLAAGTYYLTLENAVASNTSHPVYWDVNNTSAGNAVQYFNGSLDGNSNFEVSFEVDGSTTPEPASMVLLGAGLAGLALRRKFRTGRA